MITLSATACIDAPAHIVWKQLAELEGISRWAPSIRRVTAPVPCRAESAPRGRAS